MRASSSFVAVDSLLFSLCSLFPSFFSSFCFRLLLPISFLFPLPGRDNNNSNSHRMTRISVAASKTASASQPVLRAVSVLFATKLRIEAPKVHFTKNTGSTKEMENPRRIRRGSSHPKKKSFLLILSLVVLFLVPKKRHSNRKQKRLPMQERV